MAFNILKSLSIAINSIERAIGFALGHRFPPGSIGAFAHDFNGSANFPQETNKTQKPFSLRDLLNDGILWAVPKTRRPIEKRLSRRFGYPDRHYKMIVPKTTIVMCPNCGHDYEVSRLCGNCYEKVKMETKEMQDAIQAELKLDPVEKEVIVIYENEKENAAKEFWTKQRLVEMPKKRPDWFHPNLRQSTTQEPSDSKEVKPTELA